MNCTKCGQHLTEEAKFCPNCGTRVEKQQSNGFCTICGTRLEPSARFCPSCGVKVEQITGETPIETAAPEKPVAELKLVSMYEGTPTMGIAKATGTLSVYYDRIEYVKQIGNAFGGAFGLAGLAVARSKVKDDPIDIYPVSQISQLSVGKYCGVYNTLVVVLRDGTTVSFCPAVPGSSVPQNIVSSLQPYLRQTMPSD